MKLVRLLLNKAVTVYITYLPRILELRTEQWECSPKFVICSFGVIVIVHVLLCVKCELKEE